MINCFRCGKFLSGEKGNQGQRSWCVDCVKERPQKRSWKGSKTRFCRHCQARHANRPLGLCWRCWHLPGVRELYPSESKFCTNKARGIPYGQDHYQPEETAPVPTSALPGSAEKVAVLEERVRLGQKLWDERDAEADAT